MVVYFRSSAHRWFGQIRSNWDVLLLNVLFFMALVSEMPHTLFVITDQGEPSFPLSFSLFFFSFCVLLTVHWHMIVGQYKTVSFLIQLVVIGEIRSRTRKEKHVLNAHQESVGVKSTSAQVPFALMLI